MNLSIEQHFCDLTDPRIPTDNHRHHLMDIGITSSASFLANWEGAAYSAKMEAEKILSTFLLPGRGISRVPVA